jgi:hypothetical protein
MEKLCFVKGCIQPAIGGKRTDDGLDVPLCEFHFSEDFLAHLDEDEKEDGVRDLTELLGSLNQASRHLWN